MKDQFIRNNLRIKHRVISVKRLQNLQADINKTEKEGNLSNNKVFRHYIGNFNFQVPEELNDAKYVIVLAIEHNLAKINFHLNGSKHEIIFSSPYHKLGVSVEEMTDLIRKEIIKEAGFKVEHNRSMHLKLLAVRSGLGRYGRNNICYVDELGSFVSIYTFFTDYDFQVDNWHELRMLDECETCAICYDNCPTGAISEESFVIDIEKCIPLYNEIQGEFPEWFQTSFHSSLMGCIKCQEFCPANEKAIKKIIQLEDITEEETKMILDGRFEEKLALSIGRKLKRFDNVKHAEYFLPVIKRNLEVLLE
ncbi:MAG: epoxyqueuosine reductase [Asgard group archaeon]|nr:epoxyqueuosine reductase [Asgard group archaeon]